MIEQLKTIREALVLISDTHVHTYQKALTALTQLEAMAGEQELVAWTIAGEITDWSKNFSMYKTQHYNRPVFAAPVARQPQCHKRANDYCKCSRKAMLCDGVGPAQQPQAEAVRWCPDVCPITGKPFFMWIDHPRHGSVPTYGGPYDSYTIPVRDDAGSFCCERYDHDNGWWVADEVHDVGVQIVSDQAYVSDEAPQQDEAVPSDAFLADVMTAAGLVTHGKQCKALGERLMENVAQLRAAIAQQKGQP